MTIRQQAVEARGHRARGPRPGSDRRPPNLRALYDSVDPDLWLDIVELHDDYRLYYCRCGWYSTPARKPVGHLDSNDIDHWACAGHPVPD